MASEAFGFIQLKNQNSHFVPQGHTIASAAQQPLPVAIASFAIALPLLRPVCAALAATMKRDKRMNKRRLLLFIIDIVIFVTVFAFLAYFIQISATPPPLPLSQAAMHCGAMLACVFLMRVLFGLYVQIWRYANVRDYLNLIVADFFGGVIYLAVDRSMFTRSHLMVASAIAIVCSVLIASLSARFTYQRLRYYINKRQASEAANRVNVLVVGAGRLGTALVQELQ